MRRSTSTSLATALLLLSAGAAQAASPEALRARTLELEAGLAKTPAIYLFVDPAQKVLEVRSRGMALDRDFFLDTGEMRPHQVRLEGGDASSDSYCYA